MSPLHLRPVLAVVMAITLLAACAPAPAPGSGSAPGGGGSTANSQAPAASAQPKVLRMGLQQEPAGMLRPGTLGGMTAYVLANDDLTGPDPTGKLTPRMAAALPSVEDGTWKIAPDGSMDVTWKLRPNIVWHDGAPVTSDDFVFSWEYLKAPGAISEYFEWIPFADSVTAVDPLTFVVHFPRTYATANVSHSFGGPVFQPLPRHILGDLFAAGDIDAFNNAPHWSDQYVGVGPYRITQWNRGSSMQLARNDGYYMGRPPLDRVIVNFYPDLNTMLSTFLAGELDVCTNCKFSADQANSLQQRWAGTENRVEIGPSDKVNFIESQSRSDVAVRPAALRDPALRQAVYRALDRAQIADAIGTGNIQPADSWIAVNDPRRQDPALAQAIIPYAYDPTRAERDLEALGWRRGADGVLVNQDGERLAPELRTYPDAYANRLLAVVGDQLKAVGIDATQQINSPQQMLDREYLSLFPGWQVSDNPGRSLEISRLRSSGTGTPANRYAGSNRGGYSSPQMDGLYDRLALTIPDNERTAIQAQIVKLELTDLPLIPLFWGMVVHVVTARVRNVPPPTSLLVDPHNEDQWDLAA